jgi:hypothetical protein
MLQGCSLASHSRTRGPFALISPTRLLQGLRLGCSGASKPNPPGRPGAGSAATARLMMVDVNVGIEILPRVRLRGTWFGASQASAHAALETHRCERFTPRTLSSPDVREIRWFLHLRFARDVPGKAPVQRSSANGRAISADTPNVS